MNTFNFNEMVETVRELYPAYTKNITFVLYRSYNQSISNIANWFKSTKTMNNLSDLEITKYFSLNSCIYEAESDKALVIMSDTHPVKSSIETNRSDEDKEKDKFFTFLHETSHAILKHSYSEDPFVRYNLENEADLLACKLGKEVGLLDDKFITEMSNQRLLGLWIGCDTTHYTSLSLDSLNNSGKVKIELLPNFAKAQVSKHIVTPNEYSIISSTFQKTFTEKMAENMSFGESSRDTEWQSSEQINRISSLFNQRSSKVLYDTGKRLINELAKYSMAAAMAQEKIPQF